MNEARTVSASAADFQRPADLAHRVVDTLRRHGSDLPVEVAEQIFEILFFASLRTEEGEDVVCQIAYIDPENPDPDRPERVVKDRWQAIPLDRAIPMTVPNIVKMAKATYPRTSSFATYVHPDRGLEIWGLIDQGNRYYDFINFDSESGPPPPGLFLASIDGPGELTARDYFTPIATLKVDRMLVETVDVFRAGPVLDALKTGIDRYISRAREAMTFELFDHRGHWPASLTRTWIESLCRILLRARRYGHGGAVLVTPDESSQSLNVKYGLNYDRLKTALDTRADTLIRHVAAEDEIHELMEQDVDEVAMGLYLEAAVQGADEDDNRSELDGVIWFISLLTRVDGLVLMTPDLAVRGFGVEIITADPPSDIRRVLDDEASASEHLSYTQYGTRHRSMMRYCWAVPGSVGFVISQDGDVRVMTRRGDELLVWENPLLQMQIERRRFGRPDGEE
jgi:hypothetical protein